MRPRQLASVVLLALAPSLVLADRRLDEVEEGIEAGDCEIEAGFERSRVRGRMRQRENAVTLACGIGWGSELTLAAGRERAGTRRVDVRALELKLPLLPRREKTVGWALEAALADERSAGRSWRRNEYALLLEATVTPRPDWLAEVKLGWARELHPRADRTVLALGVEHALSETWEARAELEGDDREPASATLELRWIFVEDFYVTLGFGRRLGGDRERLWGLTLGIEF